MTHPFKDGQPFKRLLVANRGEIAIRILRASTELNITTGVFYSFEDRFSLFRFKADEAYQIGTPGNPVGTYLDARAIVDRAKALAFDAIHPGYGFLSENQEFAEMCREAGICFVGPEPRVLGLFGDKVKARTVAKEAGLPVIEGATAPVATLEEAKALAQGLGYPVTLKAVAGGGGRGIRMVINEKELALAFPRARSEALASFGSGDIYLEKRIEEPKHIEVQLLGDSHGRLIHLHERDCSIQRRHQKVVEVAPALGVSPKTRRKLHELALGLGKHVNYQGLGTVEFLVDPQENIFFLEVNPRVQVEHTVTEMIAGVDLVQASILVAAGCPLDDPRIGLSLAKIEKKTKGERSNEDSVPISGAAIQCRITTEDPTKEFAPDIGEIIAYRPACGFGIRLDEGLGTAGGLVTPHYDSLLVKVTAHAHSLPMASAKMHRTLSEFRIRGVKHNIPLLKNVVVDPDFLGSKMTTAFFDKHPGVFKFSLPRDRATKLLRYIGEVSVNNPHDLPKTPRAKSDFFKPEIEDVITSRNHGVKSETAKLVFDEKGATGLKSWILSHPALLLTDTTMRDAHQSLFATRLRTIDMLKAAPFYRKNAEKFFSLEVWGGATFDTCLRFLKEDPWERLAKIRQEIPNIILQMLLRGDNAVGYTNYPKWVIQEFIRQTASAGLDLFRIFDCLNQKSKMEVAISEVKKNGAICEVCVCYTGNVIDKQETKYTLGYYLNVAKDLEKMGADIICIKDMAGLLRPQAATVLIKALSETVSLPIHLHTHDTSGAGVTTLLSASRAGCHIVDGAVSSMAGLTSQPSLNALLASLMGDPKCPEITLPVLDELARYFAEVRNLYQDFDPGIKATSTDVYEHEIPGGQYSNLYEQARRVGVSAKGFYQLTKRYQEVNQLLGNIIKVTPSSKVVGDFALLLQKMNTTGPDYLKQKPRLDYPDSVVSFFKGDMGEPYGGFNEEVKELVLASLPKEDNKSAKSAVDNLQDVKEELEAKIGRSVSDLQALTYRLYPKVFLDYCKHLDAYGKTEYLDTNVFFYGLQDGQETVCDLEAGKTLIIQLRGVSNANPDGNRTLFFKLNGFPRAISIMDRFALAPSKGIKRKADPQEKGHVGASMPGKVLEIVVKSGQTIDTGDKLIVTESMKMEYVITAKGKGKVKDVLVAVGAELQEGDLLMELELL
jgi:pyruvate carboxylase